MNEARILKALLFITQESGGLGPPQLDLWLGKLQRAGYIKAEQREVKGHNEPYWQLTEEGKAKL